MTRSREPEPSAYCDVCEKALYEGEQAILDKRHPVPKVYVCLDCYEDASKKDLIEWFGGSFEDVEGSD